jgi:hypothetical protein
VTSRRLFVIRSVSSACAVMGMVAGCGSSGSAAPEVATGFYDAIDAGDTSQACDLLAPQTRRELEQSEHTTCQRALARAELPVVDETVGSSRFGHHAQVRFDNDTVFLAEYDSGWKVIAAGCTARGTLPYDCVIKGV